MIMEGKMKESYGRSPSKIGDYIWILIERNSRGAIVAII